MEWSTSQIMHLFVVHDLTDYAAMPPHRCCMWELGLVLLGCGVRGVGWEMCGSSLSRGVYTQPEASEKAPSAGVALRSRGTRACVRCSGDEASDASPSDDSEGEERERWVLPYESVHGGLEWVACAA
jgi:hypothetical protein